jgi:hypothetical protein
LVWQNRNQNKGDVTLTFGDATAAVLSFLKLTLREISMSPGIP